MKRVMVVLIAGTILSGLAAAYASTIKRASTEEPAPTAGKDDKRLATLD